MVYVGFLFLVIVGCLQALSKALTEDELCYLRAQFMLLEPNNDGRVSLDNFKMVNFFSLFYLFQVMRWFVIMESFISIYENGKIL